MRLLDDEIERFVRKPDALASPEPPHHRRSRLRRQAGYAQRRKGAHNRLLAKRTQRRPEQRMEGPAKEDPHRGGAARRRALAERVAEPPEQGRQHVERLPGARRVHRQHLFELVEHEQHRRRSPVCEGRASRAEVAHHARQRRRVDFAGGVSGTFTRG